MMREIRENSSCQKGGGKVPRRHCVVTLLTANEKVQNHVRRLYLRLSKTNYRSTFYYTKKDTLLYLTLLN